MTLEELINRENGFKKELAQLLQKYETKIVFTPEGDTVDVNLVFEPDAHDAENGPFVTIIDG